VRYRSGLRAAVAAWAVAAVTGVAEEARAELHEAAERVAEAWRGTGASVAVDRTRFLTDESDDDRPVVIALPELPPGACTTVVLLGARGLGFHVRLPDARGDDAAPRRVPSVAGVVSIERCGNEGPRRLVVATDSGRGAIETVVGRSAKPLPPLRSVLPERSGGPLMPASEAGPLPPLPAPERRADVAETRGKRDGASIGERMTWQAEADGTGRESVTLDAGCHTLQLFALDLRTGHPGRRGKLDLDAEMREESGERLLARDRTDAPDALLSACFGESTPVHIVFTGSPPSATVLVAHSEWALPEHLPSAWGAEARGRMAHVLQARHIVSLPREAALLAQGGSGTTPLPLALEPGACYLALVTPVVKEAARAIGLRVRVGATDASDDRGIDTDGAVVAFCAGSRSRALAEVQARGTALLGWGFALYRVQSGIWRDVR
jgi:hypothetical protein